MVSSQIRLSIREGAERKAISTLMGRRVIFIFNSFVWEQVLKKNKLALHPSKRAVNG